MEYQSQESLGHQQNKATGELALDLIAPIVNVMWNKWPMSLLGISGRHWSSSSSHSAEWRVIHHHRRSLSIPCSTSLFFFVALVTLTVTATTGAAATATAGGSGGGSRIVDHDQQYPPSTNGQDFLLQSAGNSTVENETKDERISSTQIPPPASMAPPPPSKYSYAEIFFYVFYTCGLLILGLLLPCCFGVITWFTYQILLNYQTNEAEEETTIPLPTYSEAVGYQVVDDIISLPLVVNECQQIHFENECRAPLATFD